MASQRYGYTHQRIRATWAPRVARGEITCWRCGLLIEAGTPWELGHDDDDVTQYRGPEHANQCNRAAGGRKAGRNRRARALRVTSRDW